MRQSHRAEKIEGCATINKGLFSWGTTQYYSATDSMINITDLSSYNKEYSKTSQTKIKIPVSKDIKTKPLGQNTLYGVNTATPEDYNNITEENIKFYNMNYKQNNHMSVPAPKIIPNLAVKIMNDDNSSNPNKSVLDYIKIAEFLAEGKKNSKDYQYYLDIVSTLKKIEIIKQQRELNDNEKKIEDEIKKTIDNEIKDIVLPNLSSLPQPTQPTLPIQPTPPPTPTIPELVGPASPEGIDPGIVEDEKPDISGQPVKPIVIPVDITPTRHLNQSLNLL